MHNKYSLKPILAAEIEFYVNRNKNAKLNIDKEIETSIDRNLLSKIIGLPIKAEKGHNQFEIDITPSSNVEEFIYQIRNTKNLISSSLIEAGYQANFASKPYIEDYGSAMHFHLNFVRSRGSWPYETQSNYSIDNFETEKVANILCNYAFETLQYFLPTEKSFVRLDNNFMSPTHICWGGNNRTCLIRIPDSMPRRVEHRLAGADIDPIYPVYAILASILAGIENPNLQSFEKIHGNAFDEQYNLDAIKLSLNSRYYY